MDYAYPSPYDPEDPELEAQPFDAEDEEDVDSDEDETEDEW